MTGALALLYLALGGYYALFIGAFAWGWRREREASDVLQARAREARMDEHEALPFVSIIVSARNEAATIGPCLDALLAQDYPAARFEVLVVDDASTDGTGTLVKPYVRRSRGRRVRVEAEVPLWDGDGLGGEAEPLPPGPRVHLLRVDESRRRLRAHKKHAIEQAAARARGRLLFTTDADCTVGPRWLRTMAAAFPDAGAPLGTAGGVTGFVSGPVLFHPGRHVLLRMQALEFLGLAACGAGAIGAGRPTLANGANVAYRADLFRALGGFSGLDHLTSGDDELLMQRIHDHTPHRVRFCAAPEAAVSTWPVRSLRAFFEQRRRWASKGTRYPNAGLVAMLVPVFLFYLALLLAPLALALVPALAPVFALVALLKVGPELTLLASFARRFERSWLLRFFAPAQILQVPYIVIAALAGALGGYEWKGRRVER